MVDQHPSHRQSISGTDLLGLRLSETDVADHASISPSPQHTDTGPTSPSVDPITPGYRQRSHWRASFVSHWYDSTWKKTHEEIGDRTKVLEENTLGQDQRCGPGKAANILRFWGWRGGVGEGEEVGVVVCWLLKVPATC